MSSKHLYNVASTWQKCKTWKASVSQQLQPPWKSRQWHLPHLQNFKHCHQEIQATMSLCPPCLTDSWGLSERTLLHPLLTHYVCMSWQRVCHIISNQLPRKTLKLSHSELTLVRTYWPCASLCWANMKNSPYKLPKYSCTDDYYTLL